MAENRRMSNGELDALERSLANGDKAVALAEKAEAIMAQHDYITPAVKQFGVDLYGKVKWPGRTAAAKEESETEFAAKYETWLAQRVALLLEARKEAQAMASTALLLADRIRHEIDCREAKKRGEDLPGPGLIE